MTKNNCEIKQAADPSFVLWESTKKESGEKQAKIKYVG